MIKFVAKAMSKLLIPVVVINIAAIGSVFYAQGKLDAIKEIDLANAAKETVEV